MATIIPMHSHFIQSALRNFVSTNRDRLTGLLGIPSSSVNDEDMADLLKAAIGPQIQACLEYKGRLDSSMIDELSYLPDSMRNVSYLSRRLSNRELFKSMNKPIHKAIEPSKQYGPLVEQHMQQWREYRMRKEMEALAAIPILLEKQVMSLMSAMKAYQAEPSFMGKLRVKTKVKAINKTLVSAHRRARMSSIWAIRSGFSGDVVMKAINRLYIQRMRRLSKGMVKIDKLTRSMGIDLDIAPGIERRTRIISKELMAACADPNVLSNKTRYTERTHDRHNKHDISGASYG